MTRKEGAFPLLPDSPSQPFPSWGQCSPLHPLKEAKKPRSRMLARGALQGQGVCRSRHTPQSRKLTSPRSPNSSADLWHQFALQQHLVFSVRQARGASGTRGLCLRTCSIGPHCLAPSSRWAMLHPARQPGHQNSDTYKSFMLSWVGGRPLGPLTHTSLGTELS